MDSLSVKFSVDSLNFLYNCLTSLFISARNQLKKMEKLLNQWKVLGLQPLSELNYIKKLLFEVF